MSSLIAVLLPIVLSILIAFPGRVRSAACRVAPFAPLALLAVILSPSDLELGLHLVGLMFAPDAISAPLIWLTVLAWSVAGWIAADRIDQHRAWFWLGWLLSLAGMNLLVLSGNLVSFYLGFTSMSIAAYLLVVHAQTTEAWRAGRIYLVMAVAGEVMILAGVLLIAGKVGNAALDELQGAPAAALAESPARWLLLIGFAVKLGILPLHIWLPLAHPVAPIPASAILSGVIVKAGLMGWVRMVPAFETDAAFIAQTMLAIGLLTAFAGVILGLMQQRLKTVLAYSTISQMGLLLCGFSALFFAPSEREAVVAMLGLLALHHGLNKAALFLGCACSPGASRLRLLLFALPALSLAGLPMTSGFLTKGALKETLATATIGSGAMVAITLTSTATALLMWKACTLARSMNASDRPMHVAWPLLIVAAAMVPWFYGGLPGWLSPPTLSKLANALWPLLLAAALIGIARRLPLRSHVDLPEGDVVVLLERLASRLGGHIRRWRERPVRIDWRRYESPRTDAFLARLERSEASIPVVGVAVLAIAVVLWMLTGFYSEGR